MIALPSRQGIAIEARRLGRVRVKGPRRQRRPKCLTRPTGRVPPRQKNSTTSVRAAKPLTMMLLCIVFVLVGAFAAKAMDGYSGWDQQRWLLTTGIEPNPGPTTKPWDEKEGVTIESINQAAEGRMAWQVS